MASRRRLNQGLHRTRQVLNAGEERSFVEESVIDGDVEATARFGIKEAVEAGSFHIGTNR